MKINDKGYTCQTDGKERVLDMIMKKIPQKDQQILVFQSISNRSCLVNLGLPSGVLDENDTYECRSMHRRKHDAEKLMRKFDVAIFDDSWDNIKYFYVKISEKTRKLANVSSMSQFANILQVPFFNGEESYFEALVRDGRFDIINDIDGNLKICSCHFVDEEKNNVSLEDKASSSGLSFELHRKKGTMLISGDVKPLTCPSALEQSGELVIKKEPPETPPGELEQHQALLTQESSGQPNATSVGTTVESSIVPGIAKHSVSGKVPDQILSVEGSNSAKKLILPTLEEFENLIQSHFEINVKETSVKVKDQQIEKAFKKAKYDNFALAHNHELSVSDLENSLQLCHSTGAVVEKLINGKVNVKGTCFRVGPKYVITNLHVYNNLINASHFSQGSYIDFGYTAKNGISPSSCTISEIVIYSEELDYIILEVEQQGDMELPKSVTSFFKIPLSGERAQEGAILTLSGHPEGSQETVTNLICPVKNPTSLDESVVIGLSRSFDTYRQLSDQRRQSYDVSTFFHGSSGSPGVLLRYGVLLVLHCRGFFLGDTKRSVIEQGVLMSAIVADVANRLDDKRAVELFDLVEKMDVD